MRFESWFKWGNDKTTIKIHFDNFIIKKCADSQFTRLKRENLNRKGAWHISTLIFDNRINFGKNFFLWHQRKEKITYIEKIKQIMAQYEMNA